MAAPCDAATRGALAPCAYDAPTRERLAQLPPHLRFYAAPSFEASGEQRAAGAAAEAPRAYVPRPKPEYDVRRTNDQCELVGALRTPGTVSWAADGAGASEYIDQVRPNLARTFGAGLDGKRVVVEGNVRHHPTGRQMKPYPVIGREANNNLRRMTGHDPHRKARAAVLNPTMMPEVAAGDAPGGGCGFMSQRERDMQLAQQDVGSLGDYMLPFVRPDIHQWQEKSVSYKKPTPPVRDAGPTSRAGIFREANDIGARVAYDDALPVMVGTGCGGGGAVRSGDHHTVGVPERMRLRVPRKVRAAEGVERAVTTEHGVVEAPMPAEPPRAVVADDLPEPVASDERPLRLVAERRVHKKLQQPETLACGTTVIDGDDSAEPFRVGGVSVYDERPRARYAPPRGPGADLRARHGAAHAGDGAVDEHEADVGGGVGAATAARRARPSSDRRARVATAPPRTGADAHDDAELESGAAVPRVATRADEQQQRRRVRIMDGDALRRGAIVDGDEYDDTGAYVAPRVDLRAAGERARGVRTARPGAVAAQGGAARVADVGALVDDVGGVGASVDALAAPQRSIDSALRVGAREQRRAARGAPPSAADDAGYEAGAALERTVAGAHSAARSGGDARRAARTAHVADALAHGTVAHGDAGDDGDEPGDTARVGAGTNAHRAARAARVGALRERVRAARSLRNAAGDDAAYEATARDETLGSAVRGAAHQLVARRERTLVARVHNPDCDVLSTVVGDAVTAPRRRDVPTRRYEDREARGAADPRAGRLDELAECATGGRYTAMHIDDAAAPQRVEGTKTRARGERRSHALGERLRRDTPPPLPASLAHYALPGQAVLGGRAAREPVPRARSPAFQRPALMPNGAARRV